VTAKIIDGKMHAARVRQHVSERALSFFKRVGRKPELHVVLVGDDPASQVYVRSKEKASAACGIEGRVHRLPATTSQDALLKHVDDLNRNRSIDGILLQLPLPRHISAQRLVESLDPTKDVDGLHPFNAGRLMLGEPGLRPCTPLGCMELLKTEGVNLRGTHALVIGRSHLVGKPLGMLLLEADATVTFAHSHTQDLAQRVATSDVVIAAVGKPELVRGSWIKPGAILIDVGINRLADGRLVGDVEYEAAVERAALITPVPGGVGPMTIAMLLANTLTAAEKRMQIT